MVRKEMHRAVCAGYYIQVLNNQMMNNQYDGEGLAQPLIREQLQLPASDAIFYQAYHTVQIINRLLCLYTSIVTIITPFYLFSQFSRLTIYLICLALLSTFRFYYYSKIWKLLKNIRIYYLIAERTGHLAYVSPLQLEPSQLQDPRHLVAYDIRNPYDTDNDRKLRSLQYQIKTLLLNSSPKIIMLYKLQFFLYQIIHFIGIFFLLFYDFGSSSSKNLILFVVLVGCYQYVEFYLLLVFLSVVLPYYCLKNVYQYIVIRYRNYKLEKSLKSERFSQRSFKGDTECKICLMTYEPNDRVIVLKCNSLHSFHSTCLREWTKHSVTCPLCRADLSEL